ncbi:MAG: class I SAM-dependent methyltransferase [Dehalococcoidia bacterium]
MLDKSSREFRFTDQTYLLKDQYQNAAKLTARAGLHDHFSVNPYRWQRWVFDQLTLGSGSRILEVGCGPAMLWLENSDRIPASWDVSLTDLSAGMLHVAARSIATGNDRITFARVDVQSIPFADSSFDAVIANHMLYHVLDRPKAFSEVCRVLNSGGHLYAATNGSRHMQELETLIPACVSTSLAPVTIDHFRIENGAEQLAPWFAEVTLHRYEDALAITEAEPLVQYVLSMNAASDISQESLDELRLFLARELARQGTIRISKDSGLFVAQKA